MEALDLNRYAGLLDLVAHSPIIAKHLSQLLERTDYNVVAKVLVELSLRCGTVVSTARELLDLEFARKVGGEENTILRENSLCTRFITLFTRDAAHEYLQLVFGSLINEVVHTADEAVDDEWYMRQANLLFTRFSSPVMVERIPRAVRAIAAAIADFARQYVPAQKFALLAGYLFLRLYNPALVSPQDSGLMDQSIAMPPAARKRFLVLSKLFQHLSNNSDYTQYPTLTRWIHQMPRHMEAFLECVIADDEAPPFADQYRERQEPVRIPGLDPVGVLYLHNVLYKQRAAFETALSEAREMGNEAAQQVWLQLLEVLEELGPAIEAEELDKILNPKGTPADALSSSALPSRSRSAAHEDGAAMASVSAAASSSSSSAAAGVAAPENSSRSNVLRNMVNGVFKSTKWKDKGGWSKVFEREVAIPLAEYGNDLSQVDGALLTQLGLAMLHDRYGILGKEADPTSNSSNSNSRSSFTAKQAVDWVERMLEVDHRGSAVILLGQMEARGLLQAEDKQHKGKLRDNLERFRLHERRLRRWAFFTRCTKDGTRSRHFTRSCFQLSAQLLDLRLVRREEKTSSGAARGDEAQRHHVLASTFSRMDDPQFGLRNPILMKEFGQLAHGARSPTHSSSSSSSSFAPSPQGSKTTLSNQQPSSQQQQQQPQQQAHQPHQQQSQQHQHPQASSSQQPRWSLDLAQDWLALYFALNEKQSLDLVYRGMKARLVTSAKGWELRDYERKDVILLLTLLLNAFTNQRGNRGQVYTKRSLIALLRQPEAAEGDAETQGAAPAEDDDAGSYDFAAYHVSLQAFLGKGSSKSYDYWDSLWRCLVANEYLECQAVTRLSAVEGTLKELKMWYVCSKGMRMLCERQSYVPLVFCIALNLSNDSRYRTCAGCMATIRGAESAARGHLLYHKVCLPDADDSKPKALSRSSRSTSVGDVVDTNESGTRSPQRSKDLMRTSGRKQIARKKSRGKITRRKYRRSVSYNSLTSAETDSLRNSKQGEEPPTMPKSPKSPKHKIRTLLTLRGLGSGKDSGASSGENSGSASAKPRSPRQRNKRGVVLERSPHPQQQHARAVKGVKSGPPAGSWLQWKQEGRQPVFSSPLDAIGSNSSREENSRRGEGGHFESMATEVSPRGPAKAHAGHRRVSREFLHDEDDDSNNNNNNNEDTNDDDDDDAEEDVDGSEIAKLLPQRPAKLPPSRRNRPPPPGHSPQRTEQVELTLQDAPDTPAPPAPGPLSPRIKTLQRGSGVRGRSNSDGVVHGGDWSYTSPRLSPRAAALSGGGGGGGGGGAAVGSGANTPVMGRRQTVSKDALPTAMTRRKRTIMGQRSNKNSAALEARLATRSLRGVGK